MNIKIIHGTVCIDGRMILGAKIDELLSPQGVEIADMPTTEKQPVQVNPWTRETKYSATIYDVNLIVITLLESLAKRLDGSGANWIAPIFRAERKNWE